MNQTTIKQRVRQALLDQGSQVLSPVKQTHMARAISVETGEPEAQVVSAVFNAAWAFRTDKGLKRELRKRAKDAASV